MEVSFKITDYRDLGDDELLEKVALIGRVFEKIENREHKSFEEKSFKTMGLFINLHYCMSECLKRGLVLEKDLINMVKFQKMDRIDPINLISQN